MRCFRFCPGLSWLVAGVLLLAGAGPGRAQESESKAERDLKLLVERQQVLLERAEQAQEQADVEDLRPQLQALVFEYESYLRDYPNVVEGYISYAMLLGNPLLDERKRAAALLLQANGLDPNRALIKNQLGKYLAEDGRPLEALNYFLAAVQLEPREPLYHFQVGQLLSAARDDFLKSGEWTAEQIDAAVRHAFEQATALAPDNIAYAYRHAEAYYDLASPDWDEALARWRALERRVTSPIEKQTMRLHIANVLIFQGEFAAAREALATVHDPVLISQKRKLEEKLAGAPADEPQAQP